MSGATYKPVKEPTRIGETIFKIQTQDHIKKITSGSHHSMVLTDGGRIYGWGDPESGKIGRMLNTRNKNQQALRIERVVARGAVDVFCSNNCSFYKDKKGKVYGWGLNNHG